MSRLAALSDLCPNDNWILESEEAELIWLSNNIKPTEEQIQARIIKLQNELPLKLIRSKRNTLLNETDIYLSISDYPITAEKKEEWRIYRETLRNLPNTLTVIDINNIDQYFPTKP